MKGERSSLLAKHEIMKKVAGLRHIPVVDMHRYLAEHDDDGLLWWDSVHLTGAGHAIFAEHLSAAIVNVLSMSREPSVKPAMADAPTRDTRAPIA